MDRLDATNAVAAGGWDERYAVLLAVATNGAVGAALVDTNGDGADLDLDQYHRESSGYWRAGVSGNCGEEGAFCTGPMAVAWGQARPGSQVDVVLGEQWHEVPVGENGWWLFVAEASHPQDVPHQV